MKKYTIYIVIIFLGLLSCKRISEGSKELGKDIKNSVVATAETTPVPQNKNADAADDPAIWIDKSDISKSVIIGTDKKGGIATYNLQGEQINYYPHGKINNCDLRYGFILNNDTIDILAASHRENNSISLYKISKGGVLDTIHSRRLSSKLDDVYGICMYKNNTTQQFYIFINSKTGDIEQWQLFAQDNLIDAKLVRNISVPTQPEGMVADDNSNILYVGEEEGGIWKFDALAKGSLEGEKIIDSDETNENINYDIEGITIYHKDNNKFLIASSQGNYTYAIFDLNDKDRYVGSFKIVKDKIDAVEETDGIDVTSVALPGYPDGLFVVQDGYNYDENGKLLSQNFKYISLKDIEEVLQLNK